MNVDFHIHSKYSDGGKNVQEIVDYCKENDIGYISITDHNTFLASYDQFDINMLNGMELDVKYNDDIKLHMLLYDYDLNSEKLKEYYQKNREYEKQKFMYLVRAFEEKYHISIDEQLLSDFISHNNYFDKVRLNRLLVEAKIIDNPKDAFYQYTKDLKELKRFIISLEYAFALEKDSHGILSLAHPLRYKLPMEEMKKMILELKREYNLRVVEAINNHQTKEEEQELVSFCQENGLYISSGSDSHYQHGRVPKHTIGIVLGRKVTDEETTFLQLVKKR